MILTFGRHGDLQLTTRQPEELAAVQVGQHLGEIRILHTLKERVHQENNKSNQSAAQRAVKCGLRYANVV